MWFGEVIGTANVIAEEGKRDFRGYLFIATAKKMIGVVVPFDGSEGMLRHFLAKLLALDIPPDRELHALWGTAFATQGMVVGADDISLGQLLHGMGGAAIHQYRHDVGVVPDVDGLALPGIRAAMLAGAAGFPAAVLRSVFLILMLVHPLAHGAGYRSVLVANKAADLPKLLYLDGNVGVLVAVRQHARMQASLDILGWQEACCSGLISCSL